MRTFVKNHWPKTLLIFVALFVATISSNVLMPQRALAQDIQVGIRYTINLSGEDTSIYNGITMQIEAKGSGAESGTLIGRWSPPIAPDGTGSSADLTALGAQQYTATVSAPDPGESAPDMSEYQYRLCLMTDPAYCSDWQQLYADRDRGVPTGSYFFANPFEITATSGDGTPPGEYTDPRTQDEENCRAQVTWGQVVCPVLGMIDDGITGFEHAIESVLRVDQIYNDDNNSLYNIWSTMRNIALALLIPIMLVMVLGTALSFGPFDAYTVKKALPRMIAAVIFITLSWQICTFMIDLSDIVGSGVLNIIQGASGASGTISLQTLFPEYGASSGPTSVGLLVGVVTGGVAAFLAGAATVGIILSVGLSMVMALFIGYVSLAVRLIIILGLLVLSPIFILSWIFPGNDKMWKFWKTTFIGMLLLFPIIMGAIGIGRLGAYIISTM